MDLQGTPTISIEQAIARSDHHFIWRATLRGGTVILEQPGLSSDHLPAEEVVCIEYVPTRRRDFPVITCRVDVDKGERFVRYWTTLWGNGKSTQRLYVVGVENGGKHALVGFYANFKAITLAHTRPFQPPWTPEPFKLLPSDTIIRGGPGTPFVEWCHDGFGARVQTAPSQIIITAVYE